ncbi:MAG: hypothetical protein ABSG97_08785 [Sedimentisphaerales bacterium]
MGEYLAQTLNVETGKLGVVVNHSVVIPHNKICAEQMDKDR